jgi:hypothetical protein
MRHYNSFDSHNYLVFRALRNMSLFDGKLDGGTHAAT